MVPQTGDVLAEWLGDWMRRPEQAHNLEKLTRSGAEERHLFVLLPGFSDAPFGVVVLLMQEDPPLPTVAPDLPPEVIESRPCFWRAAEVVDSSSSSRLFMPFLNSTRDLPSHRAPVSMPPLAAGTGLSDSSARSKLVSVNYASMQSTDSVSDCP